MDFALADECTLSSSVQTIMECLDDTFGPYAKNCRGDFDFTLLFEETILSILPICLLIVIVPFRVIYLARREIKVNRSFWLLLKLVRRFSSTFIFPTN